MNTFTSFQNKISLLHLRNMLTPSVTLIATCSKCKAPTASGSGVSMQLKTRKGYVWETETLGTITFSKLVRRPYHTIEDVPYSYEFCSSCSWLVIHSKNVNFGGWERYIKSHERSGSR